MYTTAGMVTSRESILKGLTNQTISRLVTTAAFAIGSREFRHSFYRTKNSETTLKIRNMLGFGRSVIRLWVYASTSTYVARKQSDCFRDG